jgi:hypothetical protein
LSGKTIAALHVAGEILAEKKVIDWTDMSPLLVIASWAVFPGDDDSLFINSATSCWSAALIFLIPSSSFLREPSYCCQPGGLFDALI